MKRKNIDAAREARLWIRDLILPAVIIGGTCMMNPDIRERVKSGVKNVKNKITKKKE